MPASGRRRRAGVRRQAVGPRRTPFRSISIEAPKLRLPKSLRSGGSLTTRRGGGGRGGRRRRGLLHELHFQQRVGHAADGTRPVRCSVRARRCFLLFLKRHPCCLSCCFLPMATRARGVSAAEQGAPLRRAGGPPCRDCARPVTPGAVALAKAPLPSFRPMRLGYNSAQLF